MRRQTLLAGAAAVGAAGLAGAAVLTLGQHAWVATLAAGLAAGLVAGSRAARLARRIDAAERQAAAARDRPVGLPGEALVAAMPLGLLVIRTDGQVAALSPPAAELFGRQPDETFAVSLLRVPRLLEAVEVALADPIPGKVDFTLSRGGERHLMAHLCPLARDLPAPDDGARPALLVMIEDVSRTRRADELHRDFVANASHELKTPLSVLAGLIETLQGHARDDPEATERFLGIMAAQAERMRLLVNDLLSLNRIELNERIRPTEPQRLRHIIGEVADTMQPIAEAAGVSLTVALPGPEVEVPGSAGELAQVFRNLIDNAVKYGSPGTRVDVVCERRAQMPGMIGVSVIDDGPGIEREHIPRLTERFYRVSVSRSRAGGGTGLGLAIVKHVISRHRGRLEIDSRVGRGSRFTVWLPVAVTAEGAS